LPATAVVPAQTVAKFGVTRGYLASASPEIANRQPSTAPSAGFTAAGPVDANAQVPLPVPW